MLDALESLVGPDIEFCHNRHNHLLFKPPGDPGSEFHRDQRGWTRPVVTVIVALDESTPANGCLEVVPGSQRYGIYERMYTDYYPPERSAHPTADVDAGRGAERLRAEERQLIQQALPVPLAPGDLLLMHCCLLHGAPPNASDRTRRSVTLAYHGADELQPPEATFTLLVRGERREAKPGYRYALRA